MSGKLAGLERFYALMDRLRTWPGGERRLSSCRGRLGWPRRGVYFFYEPGEVRADGTPRVVPVGTHALTPAVQVGLVTLERARHIEHLRMRTLAGVWALTSRVSRASSTRKPAVDVDPAAARRGEEFQG